MELTEVIRQLQLTPLPVEGGYFRELYRSTAPAAAPNHCCGTSIYYLLSGTGQSAWHRVAGDEIWFYHAGSPAVQLLLFADGHTEERQIGGDVSAGQVPQSLIPAGTWQAAVLLHQNFQDWGLFGAAVFPGFEYADFTPGKPAELSRQYPAMRARMHELRLD